MYCLSRGFMRVRWAWISVHDVCAECAALRLFEEVEKRIRDCKVEREGRHRM